MIGLCWKKGHSQASKIRRSVLFKSLGLNFHSIFFIESDVSRTEFTPLAMCAHESAARYNPDANVTVLIDTGSNIMEPPTHLHAIGNLRYYKVSFKDLVARTPAEAIWKNVTSTRW